MNFKIELVCQGNGGSGPGEEPVYDGGHLEPMSAQLR